MDVASRIDEVIEPGEIKKIPIGIKVAIPKGWKLGVHPRSGLSLQGISVANSPGTVDARYFDEICIILRNNTKNAYQIQKGDRIAQIALEKIYRPVGRQSQIQQKQLMSESCKRRRATGLRQFRPLMAKLKIGDVRQEYIDEGWTLLTTEYVNLETEMESKCPEGHLNFISHKKWRARKVCSTCLENNVVHVNKSNIGPKEPGVVRILALDAATKDTGWSVFDNNQLVDYGIMRIGLDDPIARMALLRQWLVGAVDSWKPDRVAN